jgi:hypothetical protein
VTQPHQLFAKQMSGNARLVVTFLFFNSDSYLIIFSFGTKIFYRLIPLLASDHALAMALQMPMHTIAVLGLNVTISKVKRVGIRLEMLQQQRHAHQVNGNAKYFK